MFRVWIALAIYWGSFGVCAAQEQADPEETVPASSDVQTAAAERYQAGVALAEAGDCDGAIEHFEASVHRYVQPAPLLALARCEEQLLRYASAIAHYERYLEITETDASAPADEGSEREQIDAQRQTTERTLSRLKSTLGTVKVRAAKAADVWLGGRLIGKAPGKFLLPSGRHVLEFRIDGHAGQRRSVEVRSRKESEVYLEIDRKLEVAPKHEGSERATVHRVNRSLSGDAEDDGLAPTVFWIGAGLTVATAAAGTVFGLQAQAKRDEAEDIDPRLSREAEIEEIQTASRTADVLFGTAAVLGIATAVAAIFTNWSTDTNKSDEREPESPQIATWELSPALSPSTVGLSIRGEM